MAEYNVQKDIHIFLDLSPEELSHLLFKFTQQVKLQPSEEQADRELIDVMNAALDSAHGRG